MIALKWQLIFTNLLIQIMSNKNLLTTSILGFGIALGGVVSFSPAVHAELPEQMPGWCKNEVVNRFNTYMADVSITGTQGKTVRWKVESTGRTGTY